jgi:hypothetical protein
MSRDRERAIELIGELGSRVSQVLGDMVPPSAQVHLLNAQRELITALVLIYEHRVTVGATGGSHTRSGAKRSAPKRRTARRSRKIPIE